jgi:hypothetical protein
MQTRWVRTRSLSYKLGRARMSSLRVRVSVGRLLSVSEGEVATNTKPLRASDYTQFSNMIGAAIRS